MTSEEHDGTAALETVDFDLAGIVGLRIVDAGPTDGSSVRRRLHRYEGKLDREPDIVVRFTERLPCGRLTLLGLNETGFDDEGFYVLDRFSGSPRARIPFDRIGERCEIVCRRGSTGVPLLFDVIRLAFLARDFVPLHASAFRYAGRGALVTGWAKGGKTEILLSFANHGAEYIGDDWVMVSADGRRMVGIPVPVAIRDWHLPYIRELVPGVGIQRRALFGALHLLEAVHGALRRSRMRETLIASLLDRAFPKIREQNKFKVAPEEIFRTLAPNLEGSIDKVFLTVSHEADEITVESRDGREVARRMLHSNIVEQRPFFDHYRAFAFAFPDRRNPFLEGAVRLQSRLLEQAMAEKEAYLVMHPYRVAFPALFERLQPLFAQSD